MSVSYLFLQYPNCDTCRKAKKWLDAKGVTVEVRHIVDNPPTVEELTKWVPLSGLSITKFFNTSGQVYRNEGYKEKIQGAAEEQMIKWLASNGMLVKRPILVGRDRVLVGFKEADYMELMEG
jgi:arsenate reductase